MSKNLKRALGARAPKLMALLSLILATALNPGIPWRD
jgi:hypothetical protein